MGRKRQRSLCKRQRVKEFSIASRSRLKLLLCSVKRSSLASASVVTLTYPASFPAADDHGLYKGHLNTFGVAMRRAFPCCSFVWKLEFQKRGAPHYHLLLFGAPTHKARDVIRECWYRIAHYGDKNLGSAAVQCDAVLSPTGATCYLADYFGKEDQTKPGNFTGRYWGVIGRKDLPTGERVSLVVPDEIAVKILRLARRKVRADVERSRWKKYLGGERAGYSRLDVERLRSCRSSRRSLTIQRQIPGCIGLSTCIVSTRLWCGVKSYKPKRNDSVNLLVSPETFLRAVMQMQPIECPF
jgi:hypothetical protein